MDNIANTPDNFDEIQIERLNMTGYIPVSVTEDIGTPIYMPKLSNRFRLKFSKFGNNDSSDDLAMQITSCDIPSMNSMLGGISNETNFNELFVNVEDDIQSIAKNIILNQINKQKMFNSARSTYFDLIIEYLDGSMNVIESWNIVDAFITSINFGKLDYSSNVTAISMKMGIKFNSCELIGKE